MEISRSVHSELLSLQKESQNKHEFLLICKKTRIILINMKFEWNTDKERINIRKHGVTFEQASYVFADPFALNLYDNEHSDNEDRWVLLGKSLNETVLLVIHTFRDDNNIEFVRIISARKATKEENKIYNQRCSK